MSKSSGVRKNKTQITKSAVLRTLSSHSNERDDSLVARFQRCGDWQSASHLLASALSVNERSRSNVILVPPPGWLPPVS